MTEQQPTPAAEDDVQGHAARGKAVDAGHDESDDVTGHALRSGRDPLVGGLRPTHPKAQDDEDDVAGHLSGALGTKKKTDDA